MRIRSLRATFYSYILWGIRILTAVLYLCLFMQKIILERSKYFRTADVCFISNSSLSFLFFLPLFRSLLSSSHRSTICSIRYVIMTMLATSFKNPFPIRGDLVSTAICSYVFKSIIS